jgi:acyl carrier protein
MSESSAPTSRDEFSYLPAYVAPRTATEERLVEIWQHALDVDRIGIADSFEDIGGSSMIAAAIFAEIEKVFAVKVKMIMLIEAATVEELARKVEELSAQQRGS